MSNRYRIETRYEGMDDQPPLVRYADTELAAINLKTEIVDHTGSARHDVDVRIIDTQDAVALAEIAAKFTPDRVNTLERVCFGTDWESGDLDECRTLIADMRAAFKAAGGTP